MLKPIVIIPLLLIYAVVSYIIFKQKNISKLKYFIYLCLAIYLTAVIAFTLFPIPIDKRLIEVNIAIGTYNGRYNLVPFKTIVGLINNYNLDKMTALKNIGGNIFLLMPLGFLTPILWCDSNKFKRLFSIGLLSTFSIELIQVLISVIIGYQYRSFDIDDIILNSLGFIIGVLVYKLVHSLYYKRKIYT